MNNKLVMLFVIDIDFSPYTYIIGTHSGWSMLQKEQEAKVCDFFQSFLALFFSLSLSFSYADVDLFSL
jgi:hypothetical protein